MCVCVCVCEREREREREHASKQEETIDVGRRVGGIKSSSPRIGRKEIATLYFYLSLHLCLCNQTVKLLEHLYSSEALLKYSRI